MLLSIQSPSLIRPCASPVLSRPALARHTPPRRVLQPVAAVEEESNRTSEGASTSSSSSSANDGVKLDKELAKNINKTAATFAPRSSTAKGKNPAVKGSMLYNVFEYQAWIAVVVGGLLSFNLIFPSDEPSVARLLGMWSLWMFTIPALRAKECMPKEKDALNVLFVLTPLLNVILPFVWKSFGFIFSADVVALLGVYYWKGAWMEVYGINFAAPGSMDPKPVTSGEQQDRSPDS